MDDTVKLRAFYGALIELIGSAESVKRWDIDSDYIVDYEYIYSQIKACLPDVDLEHVSAGKIRGSRNGDYDRYHFISKLRQLKGVLEYGLNLNDKIVQIGSLYNSIKDEELRSRCADLLTANDHFDRVVNQATQILEDRIKRKSGSSKSGKQLIGDVIKPDLGSSTLILSNDGNEQEGYASIIRGLMQTMRNSSHHSFSNTYSREDAFAVCGFIDQLLRVIDQATIKPS